MKEFNKWYYKYPDKCDIREWKEKENNNQYYKIEEAWDYQQEKIDKLQKELEQQRFNNKNNLSIDQKIADEMSRLKYELATICMMEEEAQDAAVKYKQKWLDALECLVEMEVVAEEWMKKYDEMVDKYEPEEISYE